MRLVRCAECDTEYLPGKTQFDPGKPDQFSAASGASGNASIAVGDGEIGQIAASLQQLIIREKTAIPLEVSRHTGKHGIDHFGQLQPADHYFARID